MAKAKIKFKAGDIIGYWEYLGEVRVLKKDGNILQESLYVSV